MLMFFIMSGGCLIALLADLERLLEPKGDP
jgi:hypothetical protein